MHKPHKMSILQKKKKKTSERNETRGERENEREKVSKYQNTNIMFLSLSLLFLFLLSPIQLLVLLYRRRFHSKYVCMSMSNFTYFPCLFYNRTLWQNTALIHNANNIYLQISTTQPFAYKDFNLSVNMVKWCTRRARSHDFLQKRGGQMNSLLSVFLSHCLQPNISRFLPAQNN